MKKYISVALTLIFICTAFTALSINLSAASAVVYVKDGGTGNGSTSSSPLGSLTDAYNALGASGGKIVLTGETTVPSNGTNQMNSAGKTTGVFSEPVHTGKVVVTSADTANPSTLFFDVSKSTEYLLSGPTRFENLVISTGEVTTDNIYFEGRGNHLIMGEGITMYDNKTVANYASTKVYVLGLCTRGSEYEGFNDDVPHVTLYSGNYAFVAAYTSYVNLDKGVLTGDAFIDVLGNITVYEFICHNHGDSSQTYSTGLVTLTWKAVITRNHYFFPGNNNTTAAEKTTMLIYNGANLVDSANATVAINGLGKITTLKTYYEDSSASAQTLATAIGSVTLTKSGATAEYAKLSTYAGSYPAAEPALGGSPSETTAASTTTGSNESSTQTGDYTFVILTASLIGLAAVILISKKAKENI